MQNPKYLTQLLLEQPLPILIWLGLLALTILPAFFFIIKETPQGRRPRWEAIGIIVSVIVAALTMEMLYAHYGFVKFLGVTHLIFWTPVYLWIFSRRSEYTSEPLFAKYITVYLIMAGLCLIIDVIDLIRYFLSI